MARALGLRRDDAALFAGGFTWEAATDQFLGALEDAVIPAVRPLISA